MVGIVGAYGVANVTVAVRAPLAATTLAGTGRLDPHGMIAIPALHRTASDRPIPYTPVCADTPIPICLVSAYTVHLPTVAAALEPVLSGLADLPGAPVRIEQAAASYQQQSGNGVRTGRTGNPMRGAPPTVHLVLPVRGG